MKKVGSKTWGKSKYKFSKSHHSGAYIPSKDISNAEEKAT